MSNIITLQKIDSKNNISALMFQKERQRLELIVKDAFHSIRDIFDKKEVNKALLSMPSVNLRKQLINKIYQRKQEMQDMHQLNRINDLAPVFQHIKKTVLGNISQQKRKHENENKMLDRYMYRGSTILQSPLIKQEVKEQEMIDESEELVDRDKKIILKGAKTTESTVENENYTPNNRPGFATSKSQKSITDALFLANFVSKFQMASQQSNSLNFQKEKAKTFIKMKYHKQKVRAVLLNNKFDQISAEQAQPPSPTAANKPSIVRNALLQNGIQLTPKIQKSSSQGHGNFVKILKQLVINFDSLNKTKSKVAREVRAHQYKLKQLEKACVTQVVTHKSGLVDYFLRGEAWQRRQLQQRLSMGEGVPGMHCSHFDLFSDLESESQAENIDSKNFTEAKSKQSNTPVASKKQLQKKNHATVTEFDRPITQISTQSGFSHGDQLAPKSTFTDKLKKKLMISVDSGDANHGPNGRFTLNEIKSANSVNLSPFFSSKSLERF